MLGSLENSGEIDIFGFKLIILYNHLYSKFFAYAFLLSLIIGVFASLSAHHNKEIILGHLSCAAALIAIFAGDLIILFFAIEALMLFSCMLIFIGRTPSAKPAAVRYFMMHFIAGACMLAGVILITTLSESREISLLTENLVSQDSYFLASSLILTALLINAAIVPFSSWMTDAYPEAKTSGSLFLISYTGKVALFSIMLLFKGSEILYYFGITTMLYGALYSVIETNLRRIACFSAISNTGFALICISHGDDNLMIAVAALMFFKTIAKALVMSCAGRLSEILGITHVAHLSRLPKGFRFITFGFIFGLCFMIAFPFTGTFLAKQVIVKHVGEDLSYNLYLICSAMCFVSFPVMELFISKNKLAIRKLPHIFSKISIFIGICALIIPSFGIKQILARDYNIAFNISLAEVANQTLLIIITMILALIARDFRRQDANILLNFDFFYRKLIFYFDFNLPDYIGNIKFTKKIDTEIISKISARQASLEASIFILFLVMIVVFAKNIFFL